MARRLFCLLVVTVLLVGCGGDGDDNASGDGTPSDLSTVTEITGVIVAIDAEELGDVNSFDVKDGDTITTLYVDPEIEYGFPLGHLHQHLQTADPVKCDVQFRDGKLYAQTIEDA
jgi:hypothetical protein